MLRVTTGVGFEPPLLPPQYLKGGATVPLRDAVVLMAKWLLILAAVLVLVLNSFGGWSGLG